MDAFIDVLHHASWWDLIELFCLTGIAICLLGMLIVLRLMFKELSK